MFNESQVRAYCLAALATLFLPYASATDWAASRSVEIKSNGTSSTQWKNVQTQVVSAGGVDYAYRELGQENGGAPVVLLAHLAAVLDNWDPRVVDGLAAKHHVIAFDNRGGRRIHGVSCPLD